MRLKANEKTFYVNGRDDIQLISLRLVQMEMFRDVSSVKLATITTICAELSSNIHKYAGRGKLILRRYQRGSSVDLDIWAEDFGPGIADVHQAMKAHFSTGNSLGLGLSGIQSMADKFWIRSALGEGTLVFVRKHIIEPENARKPNIWPRQQAVNSSRAYALSLLEDRHIEPYALVKPCRGHALAGDEVLMTQVSNGYLMALIDATGHGYSAHLFADRLADFILDHKSSQLKHLLDQCHCFAHASVGAALALGYINLTEMYFEFIGIGNIRPVIITNKRKRLVSRDGMLGQRLSDSHAVYRIPLCKDAMIVFFSDGISQSASMSLDPSSIESYTASRLASEISRFAKTYDDASCLVVKVKP